VYRALCLSLLVVAILSFSCAKSFAAAYPERSYQLAWCADGGGRVEVVLPDKTRLDCLLADYAVEVDFARKWAEAIGQAMHYSRLTGKPPGVLLILEAPEDERYLLRLKETAYWIRVWTITPEDLAGRQ